MAQFLLSIYQPDGGPPAPDVLEPVMRDVNALNDEMKAAGVWVFTGGLHPPNAAAVVRVQSGETLVTDGPYIEGKEHVGGFWVIETDDREAALEWGQRAAAATTLPIEVRAFQAGPGR